MKVVTVDSAQIEARITAWICGQQDIVDQFANGEDVYSNFASSVFERPVTKADKAERFIGKTGILGLGFGVGWPKFQATVKLQSKAQVGQQIILTDAEAAKIVNGYRSKMLGISSSWRVLNGLITTLAIGGNATFGPCEFSRGRVSLPSGLHLHYYDLKQSDGNWWYSYGGRPKKIYGGALLENIVQALARIIIMDAGIRIQKRLAQYGIELALQVHDELVYVVPDELVEVVKEVLTEEMSRRPLWAITLPLASEVGVGESYGDAK